MAYSHVATIDPVSPSTRYNAGDTYWCIPSNGESVTINVKFYDAGNALVTTTTCTAYVHNATAHNDAGSFSGSGFNSVTAINSGASNGSNAVTGGFTFTGSGVDHVLISISTASSNNPYPVAYVRRAGAWVNAGYASVNQVRRAGAWITPDADFTYRSGAWNPTP